MGCCICGEKALYRSPKGEYCANHKYEAAAESAGRRMASRSHLETCSGCGRRFRSSIGTTIQKCHLCRLRETGNGASLKAIRELRFTGHKVGGPGTKSRYGCGANFER